MGDAGRDEHAVWLSPDSSSVSVAPSVGPPSRRSCSTTRPSRRARTSSRPGGGGSAARRGSGLAVGAVALDHLAPVGKPLPAVRLDEQAALVAVDRRLDHHDPGDRVALGHGRHGRRSLHVDLAMVADHQPQRAGPRATCARRPPPCRSGCPRGAGCRSTLDPSMTTECSTSLLTISQPSPMALNGPDEAVDDRVLAADRHRTADRRVDDLGALGDDDAAVDRRRGVDRAVDLGSIFSSSRRFASSSGVSLPVSIHHPVSSSVRTRLPLVDEPLDGVGDLQLAARRRIDRPDGLVDRPVEQVHADEGEVRRRVGGLLDELDDVAGSSSSAMPKRCGSGTCFSRICADGRLGRRRAASNAATNAARSCSSRLSPRYITKSSSPRKSLAISTQCASPSGASWGMKVISAPEVRAVAERSHHLGPGVADDHADLGDARRRPSPRSRRTGSACWRPGRAAWRCVRDRTEPRACTAGQDQRLHRPGA